MNNELTGTIHHAGGLLTTWKRRCEIQLKNRRKPLKGYPKTFKFSNEELINEYLNNEKLTCLLCGRDFKFLTLHLVIHGHNAESYKKLFGIISDRGLVGITTRKRMQETTIERNKSDLRQAIKDYHETKVLSDKCHCGNIYNKHRKCNICLLEYSRKHKGHLPRKISAKTIVIVKCSNCENETAKSRLSHTRKNLLCDKCRKEKYYESQKKYNSENREERRKKAKTNRLKRQLKAQNELSS